MEAVTGRPNQAICLAEKIIELCRKHTTSDVVAIGAIEIAGIAISSEGAEYLSKSAVASV
jgi:hypothetical protein